MAKLRATLVAILVALSSGCARPDADAEPFLAKAAAAMAALDFELLTCQRRIEQVRSLPALPALPGAPRHDELRVDFLGRAAGEPVIFVKAPPPLLVPAEEGVDPRVRLHLILTRTTRPERRKRLLRGGYLYTDDPEEAFVLVDRLSLANLFDQRVIWLQRGEHTHRLERVPWHEPPGFAYRHAGGPLDGRDAVLLFADRVAVERSELGEPLHRDVRGLRERVGFDRMRITHRYEAALLAELRFGKRWVSALVESKGARLELACLAATRSERREIQAHLEAEAPRRRSIAALHLAVNALVTERLPFDRPRNAEDHLSDGRLRPNWLRAYLRGRPGFGHSGEGYPVFDRQGRPHPPQTCVAMILDVFERASGTWYRPQGEPPGRVTGAFDFDDVGIENRAGVLGFETFAESHPELFEHRRLSEAERIPFRDRKRFFGYLLSHADDFLPGDIVAIQGLKRDGIIHQHAILIEDLDPLTGFPSGLVDQMTRPRQRTWEDIMEEAPLRSLLYHLRPTPELLRHLDPDRAQQTIRAASK